MQPLVRGAIAVGALAIVSGVVTARSTDSTSSPRAPEVDDGGDEPLRMPCGPRELPEGGACVPIPRLAATARAAPDEPSASGDGGRSAGPRGEGGGEHEGGDAVTAAPDDASAPPGGRVARRPDRPADVRMVAWPIVAGEPRLIEPASGLAGDADLSVLRLAAPVGTPVVAPALRGQVGDAEVLAVERLIGRGLVVAAVATTRDDARPSSGAGAKGSGAGAQGFGTKGAGAAGRGSGAAAREERWLLLFGSLDGAGPGMAKGARVAPGVVVGFVGDALSPGEPHVRFEARRLRAGIDPATTPLARLVGDAETIAVDARNVLAPR